MSGFKDTFTKDQEKEGLLGYDDAAFYYFASSVLLCIALPWTFNILKNLLFPGKAQAERDFPKKARNGNLFRYCQSAQMVDKMDVARRQAKRCETSFGCISSWVLLGLVWCATAFAVSSVGGETEMRGFDPFQILEVPAEADNAAVKKAYRKLSLVYHPDKNPDDPSAVAKFIQITKAYNALTDEVAKKNYEKYGNPDGPTTSKVGIALPAFLLEKENQLMVLVSFFFFLLFALPMTAICYYQKTKIYAPNGLMIETLQFLGHFVSDATRVMNCPELVAASAESRSMLILPSDNVDMKRLIDNVTEHKKRQWQVPVIVRNNILLGGHMQRLHHLMSPALRETTDQLLRHSVKITQSMIEIACMKEQFFTAQAMIEFRRCLVQGLDIKGSQLLQIPHFTEEHMKHVHRGKNSVSTLRDFIQQDPEQRKGLANMEAGQLADIEAFCSHVSDIEFKAVIEVEDETDMVVGDVATVTCQLKRKNLRENEDMGPVHAPLFPVPKFEEWWLFLVESTSSTRIICFTKIKATGCIAEEKLQFQVSRPGKHSLVLHAVCDSYAGLDCKADLNFNALTDDEAKRENFSHPDDEDLDNQPTLFQQMMGELNREEESEEEEEGEGAKKPKSKAKAKSKVKAAAVSDVPKDIADSGQDTKDSDDEKKKSDAGSSSSDSDSD